MTRAVYAGTFDPPTLGHVDIIKSAAQMFDVVYWLLAVNPIKVPMFSMEERVELMTDIAYNQDLVNIQVLYTQNLVTRFAENNGASVLIRSFRNSTDLNYELELQMNNRWLFPNIQTIFVPPAQEHLHISSSAVRFLVSTGNVKQLGKYLPKEIVKKVAKKRSK
jgi:pantetheine-phosphate adenylyltransferase